MNITKKELEAALNTAWSAPAEAEIEAGTEAAMLLRALSETGIKDFAGAIVQLTVAVARGKLFAKRAELGKETFSLLFLSCNSIIGAARDCNLPASDIDALDSISDIMDMLDKQDNK